MDSIADIVGWIIGALGTLVFINYRNEKKMDNEKFRSVFADQRTTLERISSLEATVAGIQVHFVQTLDDIRAQNVEIARDMTAIKVAISAIKASQNNPIQ